MSHSDFFARKNSAGLGIALALLGPSGLSAMAAAQSPPPGTSVSSGTARVRPEAVSINPAIQPPGVAEALNPQPLPPEPPEAKQDLINPAIQPPGVADALNPQPLPPEPPDGRPDLTNPAIQPSGVANALNPQPLPPEPPGTKPGVINALNPQPLPPEPPDPRKMKRRALNKTTVQQ